MTKESIEKEAQSLKARLNEIEEAAKLSAETSKFLCEQANKLMVEGHNPDLPFDRREQIVKQMEALKARMQFEASHVHDDDAEMLRIYNRIVELQAMWQQIK